MKEKEDPKWERGDPLEILIRRERRTCAGCIFLKTDKLFNTTAVACRKRKRKAELSVDKTKRCELYDDGSGK
ncbi:hypothetical protein [Paraburkholderia rhynchosiae]|uniref:Uncharacterized protein n=1 Tax=Paraburkholderia rhynchosiae TaxID=487049 RepID=A0A2N7W9B5_9BURK|nr:hypothetical protein [Paraburkholderia rhynchosiae]PMS25985.1 hypothetical protein C0Z16_28030 [Paraburkholderia rhynchosiae]CAB3730842.1 hypothetical protein LMG27174_05783 [Paraburkholderia rhynchosiae]